MRRLLLAAALLVAPLLAALGATIPATPALAQDGLLAETARVEDLASIRQIKNLQATWGQNAIVGDWSGMAALLTEDAVVAFQHGELVGAEEIEADLRETQGRGEDGMPAGRLNLRLWISPVVTLADDGQSARGRWHEVAMTAQLGEASAWAGGTWIVDYVREAREWKISHMRYYHQFAGSYADGWSHDADTLERAPYHYTPDQAGMLLPDRRADTQQPDARYNAWQAGLLLESSRAQNAVNAFGYYLDRGMYQDIVDLFSMQAEIDVAGEGRWFGHDGVRRFLARFGGEGLAPGELNDRPQLMPRVEISPTGDEAMIRTVEVGMSGQHGGEGYWSAALNSYRLERSAQGSWQIAGLDRYPLMRAHYQAGWHDPLPALLPSVNDGVPDAPSRQPPGDYAVSATAWPVPGPFHPAEQVLPPQDNALARAEAFDGAENVSNAYGYYIDQFAWRETAAVFSRDGWKELSYIGTFIGKDRVLGSLIQRYGEGGPNDAFQAIHQKTQPYVTVLGDGSRAFVRTRLWQFNSGTEPGGSWIGGIYENQVIREDGIWRIHGMDLDYVWLADYAAGWTGIDPAANARYGVAEEVIAEFGPDAPLRGQTFAPYPSIRPMGFHFANPVSGREPEERLHWSDGHRK